MISKVTTEFELLFIELSRIIYYQLMFYPSIPNDFILGFLNSDFINSALITNSTLILPKNIEIQKYKI